MHRGTPSEGAAPPTILPDVDGGGWGEELAKYEMFSGDLTDRIRRPRPGRGPKNSRLSVTWPRGAGNRDPGKDTRDIYLVLSMRLRDNGLDRNRHKKLSQLAVLKISVKIKISCFVTASNALSNLHRRTGKTVYYVRLDQVCLHSQKSNNKYYQILVNSFSRG